MKQKLFAKYSRITILVTIGLFLITSIAFYYTLTYVQLKQVDEDLEIEEKEIVLYVKQFAQLPKTFAIEDQLINFEEVSIPFTKRLFAISELKEQNHVENFRQLIFGIRVNDWLYKATVSKSLEETDNLKRSILWVTTAIVLLMLFASILINRLLLQRLWQPFYNTLNILKDFSLNKRQDSKFPESSTEEFDLMITTLERTTQQAQLEYLSLKTFSENASHEIQTPIAIIQSKLDLLIQDEALTEKQSKTLQAIYDAIKRLTRLNTSLLLLAKIENNQFEEVKEVDMRKSTEQKIADFNELWQAQNITVNASLADAKVYMNNVLADILLNNLLSNATNNNYDGGNIFISLTNNVLAVTNTSRQPQLQEGNLFQRFYKPSQSNNNNGLGLSIIKQICESSGVGINYSHKNGEHTFRLSFA
ncbi:MAG: HAMP domain-containing sensor histidine kinase [Ginsengibacter sp.]